MNLYVLLIDGIGLMYGWLLAQFVELRNGKYRFYIGNPMQTQIIVISLLLLTGLLIVAIETQNGWPE